MFHLFEHVFNVYFIWILSILYFDIEVEFVFLSYLKPLKAPGVLRIYLCNKEDMTLQYTKSHWRTNGENGKYNLNVPTA